MTRNSHVCPRSLAAAAFVCLAAAGPAVAQELTGTYTQLHSFTPGEGIYAEGHLLALPGGRIVGTTSFGGEFGFGSIFELKAGADTFTVVHSFAGGKDGAEPIAGLIVGPDGNLWGSTYAGGKDDRGTIYRMSHDGRVKVVHQFGDEPDGGWAPIAPLLVANDGLMYGTTVGSRSGGNGTVFRVEADGSVTTLWDFGDSATAPRYPSRGPLLQASDGLLYGTTFQGGDNFNDGTIFSLATDGSARRVLKSFFWMDGSDPWGGVIEGADGRLYGTVAESGCGACGAVYRLDRDGTDFVFLHQFVGGGSEPRVPVGELFELSPGFFVGTSMEGGRAQEGSVYQVLANGEVTLLHSFTGNWKPHGRIDGSWPFTGVTPVGDGNLLGVTGEGGLFNVGTVFRLHGRLLPAR